MEAAGVHKQKLTLQRMRGRSMPFGCRAVCYASLAPMKDMEITILGDELTCPAFAGLLHGALRTLIDRLGALTFNVGILNISLAQDRAASQQQPIIARCEFPFVVYSKDELTAPAELCPAFLADCSQIVFREETLRSYSCRVVSRGSLSSQASDFGGLEVFGQASIGHTDPFVVIKALDAQMKSVQGYSPVPV